MTSVAFPGDGPVPDLTDIPAAIAARWLRIYGSRAAGIARLYRQEAACREVVDSDLGVTVAEVLFVIRTEEAVRLTDVVFRRVMTGWQPDLGASSVERIAEVMAGELSWDSQRRSQESADYSHYLRRFQVMEETHAAAHRH